MSWLTTETIEDARLYISWWHKQWPKPLGELPAEHATTLAVLSDWLDDKHIDASPLRSFNRQPRTELVDGVLNLLERAEREVEAVPKSPDVPAGERLAEAGERLLDRNDTAILGALLKAHPQLLDQYELETRAGLSRKTIGKRLEGLRAAGLTHRPNGGRSGEGLTDRGRSTAEQLEGKATH